MIKVSIIGTGNVSFHLQEAFSKTNEVQVVQVFRGRSDLSNIFFKKDDNNKADVVILAISDDAISKVAQQLQNWPQLIVHTSGSVSISQIPDDVRKGVFYPVQTFSKNRAVDFKTIPICIEACNKKDLEVLRRLGRLISENVHEISSKERKTLHLAAVFVNNFTNHLYQMGSEICQEKNISFNLLKPLIIETASKIETLHPKEAQTGPAKRSDRGTIESHLGQLKTKEQYKVYKLMTESIEKTYGKKL